MLLLNTYKRTNVGMVAWLLLSYSEIHIHKIFMVYLKHSKMAGSFLLIINQLHLLTLEFVTIIK